MKFYPFEMGYLSDEMVQKAKEELGETEKVKKETIVQLRRMVKEEKNLVCSLEDDYLLQFLRARKFNLKSANGLVRDYFSAKRKFPEFSIPNFPGLHKVLTEKILSLLPYRDGDGCAIIVFNFENWNHKELKCATIVQAACVLGMYTILDPATQVCGIKVIVDYKSATLMHIRYISFRHVRMVITGLSSGVVPIRLKAIHVIHGYRFFQYMWNFSKFLLSEKIRNRVFFHGNDISELHKHIQPEILPPAYGGKTHLSQEFLLKELRDRKQDLLARCAEGYVTEETHIK